MDRVANPKDLLLFHRKKVYAPKGQLKTKNYVLQGKWIECSSQWKLASNFLSETSKNATNFNAELNKRTAELWNKFWLSFDNLPQKATNFGKILPPP